MTCRHAGLIRTVSWCTFCSRENERRLLRSRARLLVALLRERAMGALSERGIWRRLGTRSVLANWGDAYEASQKHVTCLRARADRIEAKYLTDRNP